MAERLPGLVSPPDYYPLLEVHVGASDIDSRSLESIKKDYRALGKVVRGSESSWPVGSSSHFSHSFKCHQIPVTPIKNTCTIYKLEEKPAAL